MSGGVSLVSAAELGALHPERLLGEGESGEAHLVILGAQSQAVLKIARQGHDATLLNEARVLAMCDGHFAPRLLGVAPWGADERLALLFEYAPGLPLDESWPLSDGVAYRLAVDVLLCGAAALAHLHGMGIAHGDVKPAHLVIDSGQDREVRLIDFGLAGAMHVVRGGTPRYMPQSVRAGHSSSSAEADLFGLSRTVAEILLPTLREAVEVNRTSLERLPGPFFELLAPLLIAEGSGRPTASWLLAEAQECFDSEQRFVLEPLEVLRRAYVTTRLLDVEEFASAVSRGSAISDFVPEGVPGTWLSSIALRLSMISRAEAPSQGTSVESRVTSPNSRPRNLSTDDRRRFLGRLFGPLATKWRVPVSTDEELISALLDLSRDRPLLAIGENDLHGALGGPSTPTRPEKSAQRDPEDFVSWAFQLGRGPMPGRTLREIARTKNVPAGLLIQAAARARLQGELQVSRLLLRDLDSPEASVERALVFARSGRRADADALLLILTGDGVHEDVRSKALALRARRLLDTGDASGALNLLEGAIHTPSSEEVRALAELNLGNALQARAALDRGEPLVTSDEEAARLAGVRGMIEHREGDARAALASFERATELASRAGAALEEATYSTGVAAAASDAGLLETSLAASVRAEQLFEALGAKGQAARALLSRASVLAALGASDELVSVVRRGTSLARATGDTTCEAYLQLSLCDGSTDPAVQKAAAARATELLSEGSPADRLRALARRVTAGEPVPAEEPPFVQECTEAEPRIDWLRARAEAILRSSSHRCTDSREVAQQIARELDTFAGLDRCKMTLGPALVSAAHLALRATMADEARSLLRQARRIADDFLAGVPATYRASSSNLLWIQHARGSQLTEGAGVAQLADVEALLRTLSQRRGFRAMLDQVLDLLLLWTRVERGLLLLRAPENQLVVRAARNLDRRDLGAEQRSLSYSLAERALAEGRPVVLVDAVHDVSKMHRSVHALHLRSVLAVPLIARGEVFGVAYLDDKVRRGAFGERELSWVSLIGTIAALAIADEFDRLKLERALRRARRAERHLGVELEAREAQLEIAERELSRVRDGHKLRGTYDQIVGRSPPMVELLQLVDRVAASDIPVLLQGESGTGKELVARALAQAGPRANEAFVAENCSAVPETLLESALFGHQKGAFTGASKNQAGLFELANRGTLFLDEIGDMSLGMQAKLLRVLQDGEVRPLGADRTRKVDVRVVVATHKDLKELVSLGRFREDLYYRLNVVRLELPSLRERREDIVPLLAHFVKKYARGKDRRFSSGALSLLCNHSWPGNVRQLENEVRRVLVLGGDEISAADLSPEIQKEGAGFSQATTLREKLDALERRLVLDALRQENGNRTRAAEVLGVSRFGLQKMTQRLGIDLSANPKKSGRIKDRGLDDSR